MRDAVVVSVLLRYLKSRLDVDPKLVGLRVKGEISNFVAHRSGHYYFTLKDESARINCVMFASKVNRCKLKLENGLGVIVSGSVSIYESSGSVQLYVDQIEEDGIGDLYKKYEELKKKMLEEGLFDVSLKKPLPLYPFKIGVLSAKEGAATQDVITTIKRRWPVCEIHFYPTFVQGEAASKDIVENLKIADEAQYDVILLVRGGGSIEDLWAFNKEEVVRAVFNLKTPLVSGVGHETDTTLVDYVSDKRAPTPTAAAELATPNLSDVLAGLEKQKAQLTLSLNRQLSNKSLQLKRVSSHPYFLDPYLKIRDKKHAVALASERLWRFVDSYDSMKLRLYINKQQFLQSGTKMVASQEKKLDYYQSQLQNDFKMCLLNKQTKFQRMVGLLDAYSPLKLLQKGYTLTYVNEKMVKKVKDLQLHEDVKIQYTDGYAIACIKQLKEHEDGTN